LTVEKEKLPSLLKRSAHGSVVLIMGQVTSTLISAIGSIIVARILEAGNFGILSIAQIPVSVALLFANVGLSGPVTRYIALYRHEQRENELRNHVIAGVLINVTIGGFLSLIVFSASGFIANDLFNHPELELLIKILSLSILANGFMSASYSVIEGYERMGLRSIVTIFYSLLKSFIAPLLVIMGFGVVGAAVGTSIPYFLAGGLGLLIVLVIYRSEQPRIKTPLSSTMLVQLKYGYPLYLASIVGGGMSQFFNFILPFFATPDSIGNLNAATNFGVLVIFFLTPVLTALFPLFSKLEKVDELEFVYTNVTKYLSLIILPVSIALIALSGNVINLLYGSSYSEAPVYLIVYMLNFLFIGFGAYTLNNLLNSQNKTSVTLRSYIVYTSIGLVIGVFLVPRFGVIGWLVTDFISSKFSLAYRILWVKKNYKFNLQLLDAFRPLLSAMFGFLASIGAQTVLHLSPLLELLVGGVVLLAVYAVSLPLTGSITKSDLENLRVISSGFGSLGAMVGRLLDFVELFIPRRGGLSEA
jgi:O-antigen/teichoic acid export membrane protein